MLRNQIVIDVVELPFNPVRIDHPELALIRITAVHIQLLSRLEPSALDVAQMLFDELSKVNQQHWPTHDQVPQAFRAIREGSPERGALTRVRARDLMHPRDIPLLSATLRDRLHIIDCTMDFWNDPGVSERTSARYFAGETTAYESRFLRKRQPIYFLDVARTGSRDAASRS